MNILVLEASTSSAKAMIVNTNSGIMKTGDRRYRKENCDSTLHNAEAITEQLIELGREIAKGYQISLIALSGAWHSIMLTDENYNPVTPVYTWAHTGASEICSGLREEDEYIRSYYTKTGCMVNAIYPFFKLMHLKDQGYDLHRYKIMGEGTYIYRKLTDAYVVMDSMASGSGLVNTMTRKYDGELLSQVGIKVKQLPRIINYRETNPINRHYAEKLGVEEGIPVIAPGPDGALNQVGSNGLNGNVMTFSIGTSGAIRISSDSPRLSENQSTWCYMTPTGWLSGIATSGACNCLDWAKEKIFGQQCTYDSLEKHFDHINEEAPVFLPFLFGERCPGWNDSFKAQWCDIKPEHSVYDLYHSVMEGVVFNLYQSYLELMKMHTKPLVVKLSGGVLHSRYWTQMCADVFNITLEVDDMKHSSMMGAAVLGEMILCNTRKLVDSEHRESEKIYPNEKCHKEYMKKFDRYMEIYNRL